MVAARTHRFKLRRRSRIQGTSHHQPAPPISLIILQVSGDSSHLYGDGLAMWITSERVQEGPIFGNKDYFHGLGIILDTYSNERHSYGFPRILAVNLDGKTKYDFANDGDSQSLGACSVRSEV